MPVQSRYRRRAILALADAVLLASAMVSAFLFALPSSDPRMGIGFLLPIAALAVVIRTGFMVAGGVYSVDWRRLTTDDLVTLVRALALGTVVFGVAAYLAAALDWIAFLPVRVFILDALLSVFAIVGFRAVLRSSRDLRQARSRSLTTKPVLIVGAGDAGMQVARALREESKHGYEAVGFIDDDPGKQGMVIQGVPVLGVRNDLQRLIRQLEVVELWIAMPSAPGAVIKEAVHQAREAGLRTVKVVPGNSAILTGRVEVEDIRSVQLEELLGRDPVQIDSEKISQWISGRSVLVTGAAGSIGAEICRQVARLGAAKLVMLDQDETGVYDLNREIEPRFPAVEIEQCIGDVRDAGKLDQVFAHSRPDVVFHAAAYKHVPLMEEHPDQAVMTNVMGTKKVAEAARRWCVDRFVLISTDKAVNPSSIMGATKRAAEILIRQIGEGSSTDFIAVRFGNVLGSRGSVVPVFRDQIARGGPVTVTDPEMKRYFMTIPEAVTLVLQAGTIGENGQVLVLDMGEPVKIVDLARQMIQLSGFEPDKEIQIVFTGIRPGEKLFEDILSAEEGTHSTRHDRVFVAQVNGGISAGELMKRTEALEEAVHHGNRKEIVTRLRAIVSTYQPPAITASVPAAAEVAD